MARRGGSSQNVAHTIRAAYERRPYPAITKQTWRRWPRQLPPWEWMSAVAHSARSSPARILVAGCGTGLEAFALLRRFPKAEIVAVDFAAHSIRVARRLQKRADRHCAIKFLRADLSDPRLVEVTGGGFDLITCHGVASYLPELKRSLRHLRRCLTPDGFLYLGVNGSGHFSERWREFLPAFGFEMEKWRGGTQLWRHLRLAAALEGGGKEKLLRLGPVYLGSDLFSPLIRNLSLGEWIATARRAGLHFCGSSATTRLLQPALADDAYELFLPRRRGEVAELLDRLVPGAFFGLVFTREPEAEPPWGKIGELRKWCPIQTAHGRQFRLAKGRARGVIQLENKTANLALELDGGGWEVGFLRASDGRRTLEELLGQFAPGVPARTWRSQIYLFYLLDLLNLLPLRAGTA